MSEQNEERIEQQPKPKKKRRWVKVLVITLLVILLLLLIVVACVSMYINHLLNRVTPYDEANDSTISSSEVEEILATDPEVETIDPESNETLPNIEDVTFPTEETEPVQQWDHVVNILLIGQDRESGKTRARSDSMILVTFNTKANTVTLTSFMRDSYVQIPGYKPNKLNHAYQYGGMSLLNETLRVNFGVNVDGNVEVDFSAFREVIDMLGGVDISLTQEEADYLNREGWDLVKGSNHLTGQQALAYARIRKLDNDYRRAERQRTVIMSLIERYKSLPVNEMLSTLEDILPLVTTNMDKSEIVGYALELSPMLVGAEYNTLRIPADGTFKGGNVQVREGLKNWFQYNIDFEANRRILREIFEED